MIEILAKLASRQDPEDRLVRHILGFPDSLPNLSRLKPPGENTKSGGLVASFFAHRQQGQLASTY
jgi:hypothetical protein